MVEAFRSSCGRCTPSPYTALYRLPVQAITAAIWILLAIDLTPYLSRTRAADIQRVLLGIDQPDHRCCTVWRR